MGDMGGTSGASWNAWGHRLVVHTGMLDGQPPCALMRVTAWAVRWPGCVRVAHTLQRLDPDGVFMAQAGLIALAACPAAPVHNIVEALVELVVLKVVLGHEACMARGIDEQRGMVQVIVEGS